MFSLIQAKGAILICSDPSIMMSLSTPMTRIKNAAKAIFLFSNMNRNMKPKATPVMKSGIESTSVSAKSLITDADMAPALIWKTNDIPMKMTEGHLRKCP